MQQEHKKTLNSDFDVINLINKTYAESSEYDLNDSLIFLNKTIIQTELKNKELVKSNFSKFVECRIVLEEILEDIKKNNIDQENSKNVFDNFKLIKSNLKFDKNCINFKREKKIFIINKYKTLFNLKKKLLNNFKNQEKFIEIYNEGRKQYEELQNSKYIQKIWASIKDVKIKFLDNLYEGIINEKNNYLEILYLFDLYFKIDNDKSNRKIMNTLIVNFKKHCLDASYIDETLFLKEICYFFVKTLIRLDKELQKEIIIYFFKKIKTIFNNLNLKFLEIWFEKLQCLLPDNIDLEIKSIYEVNVKSLKKECIIKNLEICNLYNSYIKLSKLFKKDEIYILNQKIIDFIKIQSEKINFKSSFELENYFDELNKIENALKNDADSFYDLKKYILSNELKKLIIKCKDDISKSKNNFEKMIIIIKIIDEFPNYFKIILKGILSQIQNNKCILYYLANIIDIETPELNNQQMNEVEALKQHFGFLIVK